MLPSSCVAPLVSGAVLCAIAGTAQAQLIPDATLGIEASTITPGVEVRGGLADLVEGGATRGSNLFHSFLEFNVDLGQRLYFANPAGIDAILTRVTGATPHFLRHPGGGWGRGFIFD
jgi:large exoprotein involved in heme utilization and adhesion